jgi:glutamyl-tRNA reductase
MEYLLLSFSHKNTNIIDRDKISFQDDRKLSEFMTRAKVYLNEIMILNTCNRVEFFITADKIEKSERSLLYDISQHSGLQFEKLLEMVSISRREEAIYHLFSVVSSLHSLVIGETQIVGQIKDSFKFAFEGGFAGQKISRAIHYSFRCSAEVRQKTAISKKKVSIASVSVSKALELVDGKDVSALVIGSGEMSRLVSQYLHSAGVKVTIINRTRSKAKEIADEVAGVEVHDFIELENLINLNDLVFSATSSEEPIIRNFMIKNVDFPRFWFDLAVPKDIENYNFKDISVFRIDDLQESVRKNELERKEEIDSAHRIVGDFTGRFFKWISALSVEPLIKNIYLKAEESVKEEIEYSLQKGYISGNEQEKIERIARKSVKKFLHGMSKKMKKLSNDSSVDMMIESINYLFDFQKVETRNSYKCDHVIEKDSLIGLKK